MTGPTGRACGDRDGGFTLIEVLTVMVVIGVLSAIAIPVFLSQRAKAYDTATKRDLIEVAKQVTAEFLHGGAAPSVRITGGEYRVDAEVVGPVSHGVMIAGADPTTVDVTGWTATAWCMTFTSEVGRSYRFSAQRGLEAGTCTSPTIP